MRATLLRAGVVAGILALCGPGIVLADDQAQPADSGKPDSKAGKRKSFGKGENWETFAKIFDANSDGKVSKEEFLAKRPGFDRVDSNHDGSVTQEEVKALPAVQKKGGTGGGFVAHFDGDADGKVSTAEYDAKRSAFFDKVDKNKDGAIEQSELKAAPPGEAGL
ncbi:MAG TPA: hypothetical protein VFD06_00740 [Candidatus Polarisedimenticolia bacterium]|nr:hypothetical protein [Candidatus Polarisedimenticolia bacterium]